MLVAAGMDAQQREARLLAQMKEAEEAWVAEEDEDKAERRERIRNKTEERLDNFRSQQVAGGEDPN